MDKNSEAMRAALLADRFADADAAFAAIEAAGLDKAEFKASADQGQFLLIDIRPKADPKPQGEGKAKGKAKAKPEAKAAAKPAPAPSGGRPKAAREAAKAEKAKASQEKDYGNSWRPLSARKWIGPWAEYKAQAEKGKLPDVGGSKLDGAQQRECKFYGLNAQGQSIFHADTHRPFEKRLLALCAMIRAKDLKALKAHEIKEISTTPNMLAKLRDLAIAALSAKAEKANGKPKAEAPAQAPAEAPAEAHTS